MAELKWMGLLQRCVWNIGGNDSTENVKVKIAKPKDEYTKTIYNKK